MSFAVVKETADGCRSDLLRIPTRVPQLRSHLVKSVPLAESQDLPDSLPEFRERIYEYYGVDVHLTKLLNEVVFIYKEIL